MAYDLRMLYFCDHDVSIKSISTTAVLVTKGSSSQDLLDVPNPLRILSIIDSMGNILSPTIYNLNTNSIYWVTNVQENVAAGYRTPLAGETYTANVQYSKIDRERFEPDKCPRCGGNGWYTSPLENNVELSDGPMRVAQEFIKALLTVRGTDILNPFYGAGLLVDGGILYLDKKLKPAIEAAVKTAENQCKIIGQNRTEDETLSSAIIEDIALDYDNSGVYVQIRLITVSGAKLRFSLGL